MVGCGLCVWLIVRAFVACVCSVVVFCCCVACLFCACGCVSVLLFFVFAWWVRLVPFRVAGWLGLYAQVLGAMPDALGFVVVSFRRPVVYNA